MPNPAKPGKRVAHHVAYHVGTRVGTCVGNQVGNQVAIHADTFTRAVWVGLLCLGMAGCAGPPAVSNAQTSGPAFRDPAMSIQSASAAIAIGASTQSEVLAALGPAIKVKFESGYEIWVYRGKSSNAATRPAELVILFSPTGVVKKTRIKPPY